MKSGWWPAAIVGAVLGFATSVSAAELKVFCSNGLRAVMDELAPQFERASGHKLAVSYGLAAAFKQQIEAGEPFDVVVVTPALLDGMVKQGKVADADRAVIARAGIGVAIRAGAARPDLTSTDAFKTTLRNAKSIAYAKAGQSGTYFTGLVERLGLAEELKEKMRPQLTGVEVGTAVANGEVELAVLPISEIMPVKGAEVAGPLPAELQSYVVMAAGVSAAAKDHAAAAALVKFLNAPEHMPVIKAKGMEPG